MLSLKGVLVDVIWGPQLIIFNYNLTENDKDGIRQQKKYSFSDAMCVGNDERYQDGGVPVSALMRIAKNGEIVECKNQNISHEEVVGMIELMSNCKSDDPLASLSKGRIEKQVADEG